MQPQDGMKRRFPFDSEDLQKNFGISRPPSSFMVIVRVTINRNQSEKVLPCQQLKSRKTEAMVQRCCVPLCTSKAGDLDIYGTKVSEGHFQLHSCPGNSGSIAHAAHNLSQLE